MFIPTYVEGSLTFGRHLQHAAQTTVLTTQAGRGVFRAISQMNSELASDGRQHPGEWFAGAGETAISLGQSNLRLPGNLADFFWEVSTAFKVFALFARRMPIGPAGGLL